MAEVNSFPCQISFRNGKWIVQGQKSQVALSDLSKLPAPLQARLHRAESIGDFQHSLSVEDMKVLLENGSKEALPSDQTQNSTNQAVAQVAKSQNVGVGIDHAERKINSLVKTCNDLQDEDFWYLTYDIPTKMNDSCPNPSWPIRIWPKDALHRSQSWIFPGLWRFGARLNLSCWCIPDKKLQHSKMQKLISHWRDHGIKVRLVRYHPEDRNEVRRIVYEELCEEVQRLHQAFITKLFNASDRLKKLESEMDLKEASGGVVSRKDRDDAQSTRDNSIRATIKRAGEELNAAIESAKLFDAFEKISDLLDGFRKVIKAETSTFNAEMARKSGKKAAMIS